LRGKDRCAGRRAERAGRHVVSGNSLGGNSEEERSGKRSAARQRAERPVFPPGGRIVPSIACRATTRRLSRGDP
jgi:hypothetical protein